MTLGNTCVSWRYIDKCVPFKRSRAELFNLGGDGHSSTSFSQCCPCFQKILDLHKSIHWPIFFRYVTFIGIGSVSCGQDGTARNGCSFMFGVCVILCRVVVANEGNKRRWYEYISVGSMLCGYNFMIICISNYSCIDITTKFIIPV